MDDNYSFYDTGKSLNRSLEKKCYFFDVNFDVPLYVAIVNITASVTNGVSSFVAVVANTLVLVAMWKNPSLHTAGNVLLSCLAFSDLMVGLISQPAYILYKYSESHGDFQLLCITQLIAELTGWTAAGVSFLTLTAIGVERYISLYRPFTYHTLITTKRTLFLILFFWVFFILKESARFWFLDSYSASYIIVIVILLCLSLSLWSYWKIYSIASRHQNSVRNIARVTARLHGKDVSKTTRSERKAANAMLGVFLLFLICYCPIMCCLIVYQTTGFTTPFKVAITLSATLSFVNSFLNPLWYCWRIEEIRRAIRKILLKNTMGHISISRKTIRATYMSRNDGISFE